ncbi:MAG: patatin-like phospholipase family protein [Rickettsiales bacterium]|nr:patatin-like phospholipase family protein [Rickettsiales bacterium]
MTTNPPLNEITALLGKKTITVNDHSKNLVFGGGGILAFAELGVFMELYKAGKLNEVENIVGTSAGSKMGLLVNLGYRDEELLPLSVGMDYSKLTSVDSVSEALTIIPNVVNKKGIFTGTPLREWAEHAIAKRTGHPDMTFEDMHEWRVRAQNNDLGFFEQKLTAASRQKTDYTDRYKDYSNDVQGNSVPFSFDFESTEDLRDNALKMENFYVIASEVVKTDDKTEYKETVFSHKNEALKSAPIAQVVQASASFPFVFAQEKINGKYYTDGGLSNNIALEVFDAPDGTPNPETIAIGVSSLPDPEASVDNSQTAQLEKFIEVHNSIPGLEDWEVQKTKDLAAKLTRDEYTDTRDTDRMILVQVKGVNYTDFNISIEKKLEIIEAGKERGKEVVIASALGNFKSNISGEKPPKPEGNGLTESPEKTSNEPPCETSTPSQNIPNKATQVFR